MKTWYSIIFGIVAGLLIEILFIFVIDPAWNGTLVYPIVQVSAILAQHFHFHPDSEVTDQYVLFIPLATLYFATIGVFLAFVFRFLRSQLVRKYVAKYGRQIANTILWAIGFSILSIPLFLCVLEVVLSDVSRKDKGVSVANAFMYAWFTTPLIGLLLGLFGKLPGTRRNKDTH